MSFQARDPDDEALTMRALARNGIRHQVHVAHDGVEALDFLFGRGRYAGRDTQQQPAVTLLDRAEPGHGTSRWSLAWLNSNGVPDRGYHDLRTASLDAWARLAEEAGGAEWSRFL